MVAPCPTNCTPADLLALPANNCTTGFRRTTPSRIFMFNCNTALPTGSTTAINAAMKALFDAGDIVSTSELTAIVPQDPTYEEVQISDCQPPTPLIATRVINFEDRTAVDISNQSPFVINRYFDYDFWADKILNQRNIRYMLAYCNGDVKIVEFTGTIRGFIDYIKAQAAGGLSTETKKFQITFNGDPLSFNVKPTWNYIDAGIVL